MEILFKIYMPRFFTIVTNHQQQQQQQLLAFRVCVRNLDLRVQPILTSESPWVSHRKCSLHWGLFHLQFNILGDPSVRRESFIGKMAKKAQKK